MDLAGNFLKKEAPVRAKELYPGLWLLYWNSKQNTKEKVSIYSAVADQILDTIEIPKDYTVVSAMPAREKIRVRCSVRVLFSDLVGKDLIGVLASYF